MGDVLNDLTGQRFGRLTVVKRAEDAVYKNGKHKVRWLCKCDCGNYSIVQPNNLHSGGSRSCGCLRRDNSGTRHNRFINLTGKQFGRLTVISKTDEKRRNKLTWLCKCTCGNEKIVAGADLRSGHTKSCGCDQYGHNVKHGKVGCRLYGVWAGMLDRCRNPNASQYKDYGGRGICVCEAWHDFQNFYDWALSSGYDENAPRGQCTIDRIDVNRNYEPENCRWVDMKTQRMNQRPIPRENLPNAKKVVRLDDMKVYDTIKDAGDDTGIHYTGVSAACHHRQKSAGGYRWEFYNE